jgi:hypothetical protein
MTSQLLNDAKNRRVIIIEPFGKLRDLQKYSEETRAWSASNYKEIRERARELHVAEKYSDILYELKSEDGDFSETNYGIMAFEHSDDFEVIARMFYFSSGDKGLSIGAHHRTQLPAESPSGLVRDPVTEGTDQREVIRIIEPFRTVSSDYDEAPFLALARELNPKTNSANKFSHVMYELRGHVRKKPVSMGGLLAFEYQDTFDSKIDKTLGEFVHMLESVDHVSLYIGALHK